MDKCCSVVYEAEEASAKDCSSAYFFSVHLKTGTIAVLTINTPFQQPFPFFSIACEQGAPHCWISKVNGGTVTLKCRVDGQKEDCNASIYGSISEGCKTKMVSC